MLKHTSLFFIAVFFLFAGQLSFAQSKNAYLFYYFEGDAGEKAGLYTAYTYDLVTWHKLADSIFTPRLGEWKVFRDPSVLRTKDGKFHLVWTTGKSGFGYANSVDGLHWENENFISVTDSSRDYVFANVWAPELFYHKDTIYIIWSSTLIKDYVPPKDPEKWWNSKWKHRFYSTSTADFVNFTPVKKFWNPGFNVIDAVVHKSGEIFYLFFKDERKSGKNILMANSDNLFGPYKNIQKVTYRLTEGAIPISTRDKFFLYYDFYHQYNGYRYITTTDMQDWSEEQLPVKKDFDDIIRHGSIVKISKEELNQLIKKVSGE